MDKKNDRFGFKLDEGDRRRLTFLSEKAGLSPSSYIRMIIKKTYDETRATERRLPHEN